MSFLSSHRLHWGVHHELSDNFWLQLDKMAQDVANVSKPSADSNPAPLTDDIALTGGLPPHVDPSPEALGP